MNRISHVFIDINNFSFFILGDDFLFFCSNNVIFLRSDNFKFFFKFVAHDT